MSDEHTPTATGAYGHALVRTPHLDRLAKGGVLFENTYCNSPLCVPSRMSFMTGKEVHRIGAWDNGVPLGSDEVTWAHLFRRGGYETALCGKMHFIGPDQLHGFEKRLLSDIHLSLIGAPDWDAGLDNPNAYLSHKRVLNAGPGRGAHNDYDDAVHEHAVRYLRDWARGPRERPFFLCASYTAPHFPLQVPEKYFNLYYPNNVDMPFIPPGHLDRLHPAHQRLRKWFGLEGLTAEQTRRARAAYYGLISFLDDKVGELIQVLDQERLRDNTLVIYLSDHGEMMGEHGLWWKCNFYEWSVRVPLIFSLPGRLPAGHRVREVVSLVDVVRTFLDFGGVEDPGDLDGHSLLPLLDGRECAWKNVAFSEYHAHGINHSMRMLRAGRYKLNYVVDEPPELYDLETDPGEFDDLAGRPEYASLVAELTARVLAEWDPREIEARVRRSQKARRIVVQAERVGAPPMEKPTIEH